MKQQQETEVKLAVRNRRAIRSRLRGLGFRVVQPRHFESNALFDFPDLRLWKARCLLRLRQEGKRWLLTFKGRPLESRHFKIRREVETEVGDGPTLGLVLEALGLRESFRYEKYRTVFARSARAVRAASRVVVLDETPIGDYVELEGPEGWIDGVARRLGYRRTDYIVASYATLYRQKCRERGEKPAHMIFQKS
jgi:adenylate cyclase class 2